MIPSPFTKIFAKELNFHRKLLLVDSLCDKMLGATKSITITISRKSVEIDTINTSKSDLLAVANFILDKYK